MKAIMAALGVILLAISVLSIRILICLGIGYFAYWISTFFELESYMPFEGVPYSVAFMIGAAISVLTFIGPYFSSSD